MTVIDRVDVDLIDLPTVRGHVLSMTTMRAQAAVIVRIRFSDGSTGIGEGTTIGGMSYGEESPESICLAISAYLAPRLIGRPADAVNAAMAAIETEVKGARIAKCAVETALWDGLGRRLGVSVAALFGGAVRDAVPVAWTLASGVAERDVDEAEEMLARRRHRIFKIKIGKQAVADDVAHVAAIARAVGDRGAVRVDVNQAWSLSDARWGLAGLEDVGCELVEQPIARRDLAGMAELTAGRRIAVMADEALAGPADALDVARARAADALSVKIAQSGGLAPAAQVAAIGQAAGLGLYGGTMLETGVGTAAAAALFATTPQLRWGSELFGPLLFTESVLAEDLVYRDFALQTPTGPGIGVDLDDDKLAFFGREATSRAVYDPRKQRGAS